RTIRAFRAAPRTRSPAPRSSLVLSPSRPRRAPLADAGAHVFGGLAPALGRAILRARRGSPGGTRAVVGRAGPPGEALRAPPRCPSWRPGGSRARGAGGAP